MAPAQRRVGPRSWMAMHSVGMLKSRSFASRAINLAANSTNGQAGIFVRDLATGTTTLVSAPPGGGQANGDAGFPSISGNGQLVAFNSDATNLAAGNPHGYQQVYVQNLATGTLQRASQTNGGTIIAFSTDATNLTGSAAGTPEQIVTSDIAQLPLSGATPTLTGTAKVGDTLTAHPGKWGPAGVQLRYQWYASSTAITGATAATLKLAAAQHGKRITVKVTASLTGYATATVTSKATPKVGQ
jgi:hypothetical protein